MADAPATPQHREGRIDAAWGGQVYWQSWEPPSPKAVVVIAHGLAEHSGRYAHVGERLAAAGYAVTAGDHRGHGRTEGSRGNIERMSEVLADLDTVLRLAWADHPDLPVFLVGHSLGGLIALDYVISVGQEHLRGLVLSAPAVDPSVGSGAEKVMARVLSGILPNLPVTPLDATAVSRDPEVVAAYRSDPLNYLGRIRVRTGAEALASVDRVIEGLPGVRLPLLVMQGTEDRLVSPKGAETIRERAGSSDITHRTYPGLFHEIFNEPEQGAVLDDLVEWLDAHV